MINKVVYTGGLLSATNENSPPFYVLRESNKGLI